MKRITLYQRLKPEVKNQLQENYGEYRHSIEDIFKSLHKEEHYNSLTISEVNNLINIIIQPINTDDGQRHK